MKKLLMVLLIVLGILALAAPALADSPMRASSNGMATGGGVY